MEAWGRKLVDFSSEGGAIYFDEYEAHELIQKVKSIAWHVNLQCEDRNEFMRN